MKNSLGHQIERSIQILCFYFEHKISDKFGPQRDHSYSTPEQPAPGTFATGNDGSWVAKHRVEVLFHPIIV